MRAHYLQHVPFEGLGSIEAWLKHAGYDISCTRFFNAEKLPDVKGIDLLLVMGGPMSVNDEREHPWLATEKEFIRRAIAAGKSVLGICLGAQLIANALGGAVYSNPVKEIGWFPVAAVTTGGNSVFQFPNEVVVFHWHGETFELPKAAIHIAKSKACRHQAFQIGSHIIGLQFHLETTQISAQAIVNNCRDELIVGEHIQSEDDILSATEERYSSINSLMATILEYLHANNR
ncbi:MAG: GMP synthase-like glutamine amidotransferase [Bermanella sp.]|jgi:GMP synthase-like glutamine amidotransferase